MVTLALVAAGLLKQWDGTLTGWTVDAGWSSVNTPGYSCFNPLPNPLIGGVGDGDNNSIDFPGCREAHIFRENGVDYMFYDATSIGGSGWSIFLCYSTDGWKTHVKCGPIIGLSNTVGGFFNGTFCEWVMKDGSTYYIFAASTNGSKTAFGQINYPLAGGANYQFVVWTATSPFGPWTGAIIANPGSWATGNFATNCIVKVGSTYYNFCQGDTGESEGLTTGSSPGGSWTILGTDTQVQSPTMGLFGPSPNSQEGCSVFFSPTHGIYVALTNLFYNDGIHQYDIGNALQWGSSDITVWPQTAGTQYQSPTPMEGSKLVVNGAVHVTGPNGALIYEAATGIVPVTLQTSDVALVNGSTDVPEQRYAIKITMLEPTVNGMAVAGSGDTAPRKASYPVTHTDLSWEFTWQSNADNGSPSLTLRFRSDSGGNNAYSISISGGTAILSKIVSGTPTTLNTSSGHSMAITSGINRPYRIQLVCVGNRIQLFIDGELWMDATDSAIASGTTVALISIGFDAEARCMSARTGNGLTVTGLNPGSSVTIKGPCGFVAGSVYADESGTAVFESPHYPMSSINVDGVDYSPGSPSLWGGDEYSVSGLDPTPAPLPLSTLCLG